MSCWPVGVYLTATPARAPPAVGAFTAELPASAPAKVPEAEPAALAAGAAAERPDAEEELLPEQPATVAARIRDPMAAAPSRRREEREEHGKSKGKARLVRMPLGRRRG